VANLIQAGAVLAVPVASLTGALAMPVLYLVAVIGGLGGVLYHTAYPPFFAQLVPREQYVEANSLLSATRSGSSILGPPLGGALVKLLGAPLALLVDACSFLVSAAMINRVRLTEQAVEGTSEGSVALGDRVAWLIVRPRWIRWPGPAHRMRLELGGGRVRRWRCREVLHEGVTGGKDPR